MYELRVSICGPDGIPSWCRFVLTKSFYDAIIDKQPEALKALNWNVDLIVKDMFNEERNRGNSTEF